MLLVDYEDVMFCCLQNEWGAACHPVNYKWFETVESVTVQHIVCSEKLRVYWRDKESNGPRSAVSFIQVYPDKTESMMKHGEVMMYSVHGLLLNFSVVFRRNLIENGHTLVGILPE